MVSLGLAVYAKDSASDGFQARNFALAPEARLDPEAVETFGLSEVEQEGDYEEAESLLLAFADKEKSQRALEEAYWVDSGVHDEAPQSHPFWHFEAWRIMTIESAICSFTLMLAGVLCSAGGIGGGGIYVTVLMIAGQLSVHDSVPLSKAIVFLGSISSLLLNLNKTFRTSSQAKTALIDYNIVRLVVPSSLIGTYLGVVLNNTLGSYVILLLLTLILIVMTGMVVKQAYDQYREEMEDEHNNPSERQTRDVEEILQSGRSLGPEHGYEDAPRPQHEPANVGACTSPGTSSQRGVVTRRDLALAACVLLVVIASGVTQFHARACQEALEGTSMIHRDIGHACHHEIFFFLEFSGGMEAAVASHGDAILFVSLLVPLFLCTTVTALFTHQCVTAEEWDMGNALFFETMAVLTGCLAGLVGIGGGLIFGPFFLLMGVEPAVAVATSSTCVIFTSSSTTMQYLLTDRIIISLTLMYGLVNLVASYVGTKCVHYLQDNFATRRSYITIIVGTGVLISAVLSATKLFGSQGVVPI